jgi:hypothetical protein
MGGDLEGSGRCLIELMFLYLPEETKQQIVQFLDQIVSASVEIRTESIKALSPVLLINNNSNYYYLFELQIGFYP